MKEPTDLLLSILAEAGTLCSVDTTHDSQTVVRRSKNEGYGFLSMALPDYLKAFYRCLDEGRTGQSSWEGVNFPLGTKAPLFLSGFLFQIFDEESGALRSDFNILAIQSVVQITGLVAKIEKECSDSRVEAAYIGYVETEVELRAWERTVSPAFLSLFRKVAGICFGDLFSKMETRLRDEDLSPGHGPGATADSLLGNKKWMPKFWPDRLEHVFPQGRWAYTSWKYFLEDLDGGRIHLAEPGTELPSKVIHVPKTPKGPRIIAEEPTSMQYMQQAMLGLFANVLRYSKGWSSVVGIEDQVPNQLLARSGSLDGHLATLDLSEASDRVSALLVRTLLHDYPTLREAVFAVRTEKAKVPGFEELIPLAKYASMGSALTFVIEAIVFATCVATAYVLDDTAEVHGENRGRITADSVRSLVERKDISVRFSSIRRVPDEVRVYGDDIIVPRHYTQWVIAVLETSGLKVNSHKSFWKFYFRESCGKEYFKGIDISHVKMRQELPSRTQNRNAQVESIVSTVSLRNQLYAGGWWQTVRMLDRLIEDFIPFPAVDPTSACLGKLSFLGYETQKWHKDLQYPMVLGMQVKSRPPVNSVDDYYALAKCLVSIVGGEATDLDHLNRSGRPSSLYLKKRWLGSF